MCSKLKEGTEAEKQAFVRAVRLMHATSCGKEFLPIAEMIPTSAQKRELVAAMQLGDAAFVECFKAQVRDDPDRFLSHQQPKPPSKRLTTR